MRDRSDKPPMTLRQKYGIPEPSDAWDSGQGRPIIGFWTDERNCVGVAFSKVASILYEEDGSRKLTVNAEGIGTFLVEGPRVLVLLEQLASHQVSTVKVDKKDITSITFIPRKKQIRKVNLACPSL